MTRVFLFFLCSLGLSLGCQASAKQRATPGAVKVVDMPTGQTSHRPVVPGVQRVASALRFSLPAPKLGASKLSLWATNYYLPIVNHAKRGAYLRDGQGRQLGVRLRSRDWCEAAMQGSVQIRSGDRVATYNFSRTRSNVEVNCRRFYPRHPAISRSRFKRARGAFGDGVGGRVLVPFRTIAVDPDSIPLGSVLFIPAAKGAVFADPSGAQQVHDGYFLAGDIGGAIKTTHIDVFTGTTERSPLGFVKSKKAAVFDAYLIDDPKIRASLEALHRSSN